MGKLLVFSFVFLLIASCKKETNTEATGDTYGLEIASEDLPKKAGVNAKVTAILKNWPEYNALDTSFDAIYTIENEEDLKLILEDLIAKQKLLAASNFPKEFNKPQIESRQKVFQTYVLKVKGNLEYRTDATESIKEMINAYNAVRKQYNIIVNNTLDTTLILED